MHCPSCGFENTEGVKFCHECGRALRNRCPGCGNENPLPAKFCGECGRSLASTPTAGQKQRRPTARRATRHQAKAPKATRSRPAIPEGERRQLTVLFCDLVGSTALSEHLDPEDLQTVVHAYQETCTAVIQRYEGYIAQHLGDGLLVYFGYPRAHEDEAQRAVQTGLRIVAALPQLNARLQSILGVQGRAPLQVRIGIHTGLVVVSELGRGVTRESLALGETPNSAARVQGLAEPDTVVVSAATQHLVTGLFECQELGPQTLKGLSTPVVVYRVVRESAAQSRFEAAMQKGLAPLVGRT